MTRALLTLAAAAAAIAALAAHRLLRFATRGCDWTEEDYA